MYGLRERQRARPVDVIPPGEFAADVSVSRLKEEDIPQYLQVLTTAIKDIPGMSAEEKQLAVESKTAASYREKLRDPEAFLFVAKKGGTVVGILEGKLAHYPDAPDEYKTMGYTAWTGVAKEHRQYGVATSLKAAYEATCRSRGITYMQSFIKDANTPSIITNTRMGYRPDSHFPARNNGKYYTKKIR